MKRRRTRSFSSVASSSSGRFSQRNRRRVAASNTLGTRYTAAPRISPRIEITRKEVSSPLMDARITAELVTDRVYSHRPGRPEDATALIELLVRCDGTTAEWAPEGW